MKLLATVLALAALSPAVCTTKEELKKHNKEDVSFVQAMIPHHEQAIHMVELVLEHGNSPDVRKLATTIKVKQEEELKTMEHLLHEWHMKKEEHGPKHPGMLSEEKLKELEETEGVEFDKLFLELMIEHHEGAIHLAEEAEHKGENEEVEKLAAEIKRGQEHEIEKMEMELVGL